MGLKRVLTSFLKRSQYRVLIVTNIAIISLLLTWLVVGGVSSIVLERPLEKALQEYRYEFPATAANETALELEALFESNEGSFSDEIRTEIDDYLEDLRNEETDKLIALPSSIENYLNANSETLAEIRDVLKDLPRWQRDDINRYLDPIYAFPSFLKLAVYNRLLLVTAIENYSLNRTAEVVENLEAAWRLRKSLDAQPSFISRLVTIIIANTETSVVRKFNGLPEDIRQKMSDVNDYPSLLAKSLSLENLIAANAIKRNYIIAGYNPESPNPSLFSPLLQLFRQPYSRLSAVNFWQTNEAFLTEILNQDFCSFNLDEYQQRFKSSLAAWNTLGIASASSGVWAGTGFDRLFKMMINWELTEKVLQIKNLAAQAGSWPTSIPGIETSTVCPSLQWNYQVSEDGSEMTISLSESTKPEWLGQDERDLPLIHRSRLQ
jgi:hypothetical protein